MTSSKASDDKTTPRAYRARWIVPISRPAIEDGVVALHDGKIVYAGACRGWSGTTTDLGEVAILPGLINAHTHLEFSELPAPFGQCGDPFAAWIPRVVSYRRSRSVSQQDRSTGQGLTESAAAGVAALGEIQSPGVHSLGECGASSLNCQLNPLTGIVFHEILGWDRAAIPALLEQSRQQLLIPRASHWRHGLSPHAPYTVHPELLAGLCDLAKKHAAPVAMHLGESPAEMEFLATGQGPLRTMLDNASVWRADFWERPVTTIEIMEQLDKAPHALVIHGNQLQSPAWDFLAERRDRMHVVYCPRTREFFFPEQSYPLEEMLRRGVAVAIGTDSRASNPDLSPWRELQFIAARHAVTPEKVLRLGTEDGAQALGLAQSHGRLEMGYAASLCVIRNADLNCGDEQLAVRLLESVTVSSSWAACS